MDTNEFRDHKGWVACEKKVVFVISVYTLKTEALTFKRISLVLNTLLSSVCRKVVAAGDSNASW